MISVDDVVSLRSERIANVSIKNWHTGIETIDQIYGNDWSVVFTDETQRKQRPAVPNVIRMGLDDISRLVSESSATIRCDTGVKDSDKRSAEIRERVGYSYWDYGKGALLEPKLAQDLAGSGAAFLLCYGNKKAGRYPKPIRYDPRNCYPDLSRLGHISTPVTESEGLPETQLSDLVVIVRMPIRQAEALYGVTIPLSAAMRATDAEIITYHDAEETVQIISVTSGDNLGGKPIEVAREPNPLGRLPVAFVQMDTFDGVFRGIFDPVIGIMQTWNRLWTLATDDADRRIYAQAVYKSLVNPQDIGSPEIPLEIESEGDGSIAYVEPGQASPQLFPMMGVLQEAAHMGSGYPLTRAKAPDQSIVSSTGISAMQGTLTTHVRNLLRLIAQLRQEWNTVAFATDRRKLDFDKPLSRPLGRKSTYLPSKDVGDEVANRVVYGFGAGLDKQNQYVVLEQMLGARLIARETVRENMVEIPDPMAEEQKIQRETTEDALFQAVIAQGDPMSLAQMLVGQAEGKDMTDVARDLIAQKQQEAAQPAPEGAPAPQLPGEQAPEDVQAQQTALEKGGGAGGGGQPAPSPFAPPPFEQIAVR